MLPLRVIMFSELNLKCIFEPLHANYQRIITINELIIVVMYKSEEKCVLTSLQLKAPIGVDLRHLIRVPQKEADKKERKNLR